MAPEDWNDLQGLASIEVVAKFTHRESERAVFFSFIHH